MTETYYGEFYGFRSAPFHITPDASLLFLTAAYKGAIGAIEYGINAGKGFIVVSGQVGVGKTTMLRLCLDRLDSTKTKVIYLFNAALTTAELYGTVLDEFDPSLRVSGPGDVLRTLLRKLLEAHQAGIQVVLAVDEAQNMPEQTLESLRILSNLETTKTKLLQIILVGQPELDALLKKHSLRQLAQRVAVRARLKRLSFGESCRYIQHRTRASARSRSLFTRPAQWYIALTARGIPRTINICCDNALINGYGYSAKRISLGIAREACRSLEYRTQLPRAAALAGLLILLVCCVLYGHAWLDRFRGAPPMSRTPQSDSSERSRPAISSSPPRPAPSAPASAPSAPTSAGPAPSPPASLLQPSGTNQAAANSTAGPRAEPAPAQTAAEAPPAARPDPPAAPTAPIASAANPGGHTAVDMLAAAPETRLEWHVRKGDSVYKACLNTYGICDDRTLRAVLADNPQFGPGALIHQGDTLIMPESIGPLRARPH
jgi:general secretion pathway protein A